MLKKQKKPYIWEKSLEFKEIYNREKAYIDSLRNDLLFREEWEKIKDGFSSDIDAFRKKWELPYFPDSLDEMEFCPQIGPTLEFEYDNEGKISKVVFNPNGLTQQDIRRYWKILDEYKRAIYGESERPRPNKWRDLRWFYMYQETTSKKKYRQVAEQTIDIYPKLACNLLNYSMEKFRNKLKEERPIERIRKIKITGKDEIINSLIPIIKKSIKREKERRKIV